MLAWNTLLEAPWTDTTSTAKLLGSLKNWTDSQVKLFEQYLLLGNSVMKSFSDLSQVETVDKVLKESQRVVEGTSSELSFEDIENSLETISDIILREREKRRDMKINVLEHEERLNILEESASLCRRTFEEKLDTLAAKVDEISACSKEIEVKVAEEEIRHVIETLIEEDRVREEEIRLREEEAKRLVDEHAGELFAQSFNENFVQEDAEENEEDNEEENEEKAYEIEIEEAGEEDEEQNQEKVVEQNQEEEDFLYEEDEEISRSSSDEDPEEYVLEKIEQRFPFEEEEDFSFGAVREKLQEKLGERFKREEKVPFYRGVSDPTLYFQKDFGNSFEEETSLFNSPVSFDPNGLDYSGFPPETPLTFEPIDSTIPVPYTFY